MQSSHINLFVLNGNVWSTFDFHNRWTWNGINNFASSTHTYIVHMCDMCHLHLLEHFQLWTLFILHAFYVICYMLYAWPSVILILNCHVIYIQSNHSFHGIICSCRSFSDSAFFCLTCKNIISPWNGEFFCVADIEYMRVRSGWPFWSIVYKIYCKQKGINRKKKREKKCHMNGKQKWIGREKNEICGFHCNWISTIKTSAQVFIIHSDHRKCCDDLKPFAKRIL